MGPPNYIQQQHINPTNRAQMGKPDMGKNTPGDHTDQGQEEARGLGAAASPWHALHKGSLLFARGPV